MAMVSISQSILFTEIYYCKLQNENYRDGKRVTQAAWRKRTNKNYKSESIQIKSIPMKKEKSIQKQKQKNEWKVYKC